MIAAGADLLIIGDLAIDRMADGDGATLAGGSVLHAARAVAAAGRRVATITAAGAEPEAVAAIAELAAMGPSLVSPQATSIRYAIHQDGRDRRLVLEAAGGQLAFSAVDVAAIAPRAVLLAPIAGELGASAVRATAEVPVRVAALQGWLRHLAHGEEARALPFAALGPDLSALLASLDAVVASDVDLAAVALEPQRQLALMRDHFGPQPILLVTTGADGVWLDDRATGTHHLPAARRLDTAATIGAGDAFAALVAAGLGERLDTAQAVHAALAGTADFLATRS
jgi:sugar/nucleoside kinase (ribokinase family)